MRYFIRVTAGTEAIAWREISQLPGVRHILTDHRRLDIDYPGAPVDLLTLRSVDDVYADVGLLQPIDHTRAALPVIAQGIAALDFAPAVGACRAARPISKKLRYTVTASLLGRRNYSRFEVADRVREGLARWGWMYIENAPDQPPVDLDVRVLVEHDWMRIGIRLGEHPLHRRPYKLNSLPGSLKAPVAACLCLLAEVQPGETVLDATCGAGTIAIEAAALGAGNVLAADLNPDAARAACENAANAGLTVSVMTGDARQLPLPAASMDCIVSNLPWGKQVAADADLSQLYAGLVREFERVLRSGGRAVLLTDRDELLSALAAMPQLQITSTQQISLFGSHPTAYCVVKAGG